MISRKSALALAILAGAALTGPAMAQSKPPADAAAPAAAYQLNGFRSARFGMNEADLRAAIRKDFAVKDADIRREVHPVERTTALLVTVPDVLEGHGKAMAAYILGYASKTLVQVTVTWSAKTDPALTADKLVAMSGILQHHLLGQGYQRDGMVINAVRAEGGVIVFRGNDAAGRTALLLLSGPVAEADGKKTLTPEVLQLSYLKDPTKPDIFSLPKSAF